MLTFGLCCMFHDNKDVKFRTYTKKKLETLSYREANEKIMSVILSNIESTRSSIKYCHENNIKSYRLSSDIIPHWDYIHERGIFGEFEKKFVTEKLSSIETYDVSLSLHPGQFVNLGSPSESVVENSVKELLYHKYLADNVGFKEINIHIGGVYGDKESAKKRFIENTRKYIPEIIEYLTIENDELSYNVLDCVEVARELSCRVTLDFHHHSCHELKDPLGKELLELFECSRETWENLGYNYMRTHISSPRDGYISASKSRPHSDLIDPLHIPNFLLDSDFDVRMDVEAKHKEVAIHTLCEHLEHLNNL